MKCEYLLELRDICKRFDSVIANDHVDLKVHRGEVHAIVGENGAGKTTLMNILYGVLQPDSGEILVDGEPINLANSQDAIRLGIGMIHQHFMLVPSMTVAENIALGYPPKGKRLWNPRDLEEVIEPLMNEINMRVDFDAKVSDITVGQMQRVEILKTLYRGAKIIIMDEPTATLTPIEVKELFSTIRTLAKNGHTIIFITHKLHEVMEISDRVTALRMGCFSGTRKTKDTTMEQIANMMIGRNLEGIKRVDRATGKIALSTRNIYVRENINRMAIEDFSIDLRYGEILGIAGVEGNGQTELAEALLGIRPIEKGEVNINGEYVNRANTKKRLERGLGYIPPDRMREGLALSCSVGDNLIIGVHDRQPIAKHGFMRWRKAKERADELIKLFQIKTPSERETASNLSGGNLQKVVIARELGREPKIVVASQPTRGVDIGSAEQIRKTLVQIRDDNGAVLLISSDLDEILELSDRIVVMFEGRNAGAIKGDEATEENLGRLMFGIHLEG